MATAAAVTIVPPDVTPAGNTGDSRRALWLENLASVVRMMAGPTSTRARRMARSARGSRNFRLFLSGQFVSAVGTWMNFTAMGWLVWRLTHSGSALGVNSALAFTPMLLIGAWGGVLADRFDKRRILITTQSAFAVVSWPAIARPL